MVELREVFGQFAIDGTLVDVRPFGGGHINDTYLGVFDSGRGSMQQCVLQRINRRVFHQPEQVMENIERVTRCAREQIQADGGDPLRETLTLIPARAGGWFFRDAEGEFWRSYHYIDGARTYAVTGNLDLVYEAAAAFGRFQILLEHLPGPRLHETIPYFHDTRRRFQAFTAALDADPKNRAAAVQPEIGFILAREAQAGRVVDLLARGALPERTTHNDTKLNNVLIDDRSGRGLCVIDLDTVMPGSMLYDFGDLIRMGAARADEDETNLKRVGLDIPRFDALARGYLEAAGDRLTPGEWDHLVFAGRQITYEQAMRFLGDYLNGDTYYKIQRPNHNLERARTQIKMLAEMEHQQDEMEALVMRLRRG